MTDYLNYKFEDNENFISTFDEMPLWSASFGLLMLKHLELKPNLTVLDLGSGTGFPLMELAARMGNSCKLYGIDPWKNANARARQKIKNYGLSNVEIIESSAEVIPFENNNVDLIVSNLGINNFENPSAVFKECYRVINHSGRLVLTTNLTGHWNEFYDIFYSTLRQIGKDIFIPDLQKEENHRGTIESVKDLLVSNGFNVNRIYEENYKINFLNGSAFLNHYFVKLGWLSSWLTIFPGKELKEIFLNLENNLNAYSENNQGLTLTVPMTYIEGIKN